jgi:uncharacterized protein HemX
MKNSTAHTTTTRNGRNGFAHMALVLILVVAAGIGSIAYVVYSHQQAAESSDDQLVSQSKQVKVPAAPDIKNSADLDKTTNAIDQVNPTADSQGDLNAIDSQSKAF